MIEDRIQKYLRKFEKLPVISDNFKKGLKIEDTLFNIITSSRFRRTALDELSRIDLLKKIKNAVENGLPVEFTIPFGAYKSFKLKKFSNIYWAEVFNISYMIEYLLPLLAVYSPGVVVSYSYHRDVMHEINNIPHSDIVEYQTIFAKLLDYYNSLLPTNFKFRMQAINDLYKNEKEWRDELKALYLKNKEKWLNYDEETRNKKLTSARNNFEVLGEKDYSSLSQAELDEKILNTAITIDCIEALSKRMPFNKGTHRIQLVFIKGPTLSINIRSCVSSTTQFWVGLGVLEVRDKEILPNILSFRQISELNKVEAKTPFSKISNKFNNIFYYIKE